MFLSQTWPYSWIKTPLAQPSLLVKPDPWFSICSAMICSKEASCFPPEAFFIKGSKLSMFLLHQADFYSISCSLGRVHNHTSRSTEPSKHVELYHNRFLRSSRHLASNVIYHRFSISNTVASNHNFGIPDGMFVLDGKPVIYKSEFWWVTLGKSSSMLGHIRRKSAPCLVMGHGAWNS